MVSYLKEFPIGGPNGLFNVETGSLVSTAKLISGNIPRISARSDNNGIIGNFDTEKIKSARHFENFISVNFFGNAFFHPYKASVEMKVHVLTLKDKGYEPNIALYLVTVLNKTFERRFGYGNQLSSSMLKEDIFHIWLPTVDGVNPDWEGMSKIVSEVHKDKISKITDFMRRKGYSFDGKNEFNVNRELFEINKAKYQMVKLESLFDFIKRGRRIKSTDRIPGDLIFVTAGITNTGISDKIGNDTEIFEANSLTIDMFGSVFYRGYKFGADDHITVLRRTDNQYSKLVLQFLAPIIQQTIAGKFSYGRNFYSSDAYGIEIPVPVKEKNELDIDKIETFMQGVTQKVVKKLSNLDY